LNGRIGKWILALSEFDLRYESAKAVKGQVMADFVVQQCGSELAIVDLASWTLFFDGSATSLFSLFVSSFESIEDVLHSSDLICW
jgi:hypothetical protein